MLTEFNLTPDSGLNKISHLETEKGEDEKDRIEKIKVLKTEIQKLEEKIENIKKEKIVTSSMEDEKESMENLIENKKLELENLEKPAN